MPHVPRQGRSTGYGAPEFRCNHAAKHRDVTGGSKCWWMGCQMKVSSRYLIPQHWDCISETTRRSSVSFMLGLTAALGGAAADARAGLLDSEASACLGASQLGERALHNRGRLSDSIAQHGC